MVQALHETPSKENRFPEECYRDEWVIHEDPGYNGEISTTTALSKEQQTAILDGSRMHWALREQVFHGGHCSQDITTLDERVVYRSHLRNFAFGDNFMVNHDKKEIWFFQATVLDPLNYPHGLATINSVMKQLNMFDGAGKEYQLVILLFTDDKMRKKTHGCKFVSEKKSIYDKEESFSLSELKKNNHPDFAFMNRVSAYIVRRTYFPALHRDYENQ